MEKRKLYIGIDVSKSTLDCVGINSDGKIAMGHSIIDNTAKAIEGLLKQAKKLHPLGQVVFVFENTGVYSQLLVKCLSSHQLDFCQVPAMEIHRSQGIKRGKNDCDDALMIANYALSNVHKLKSHKQYSDNVLKIKVLHTQREKIVADIKKYGTNKEYDDFMDKKLLKELQKTTQSILKNLKKNLKVVEKQIKETIKTEEKLQLNYKLLLSIPGIGEWTATYLLIVTDGFERFDDARKLACFGGVAPFPYQSGTSIKGRNKVNHFADKKLKSLLHMCALTAKKYDTQLAAYYNKKVAEGKNKMLVLNNIRNKLLHRVFAVIKRQTPFVDTLGYAS